MNTRTFFSASLVGIVVACSSSSSSTAPPGSGMDAGDGGGGKTDAGSCSPSCGDGQSCIEGSDCASGECVLEKCVGGSCTKACPFADPCTSSSQCASGVCTEGKCAAPSCSPKCVTGDACGADDECSSGVCANGMCAAVCTSSCAAGDPCTSAKECASGVCTAGKCGSGTTGSGDGGACTSSCSDGTACTTPGNCASGVCTDGVCAKPGCAPSCAVGTACGSDGDCASGECVGGTCKGGPGASCTSGAMCASGVCTGGVCSSPTCSPDCEVGQACSGDSDCTAGLECVSGVCSVPDAGGGNGSYDGTVTAEVGNGVYVVTATFSLTAASTEPCEGGPQYGLCCWLSSTASGPTPPAPISVGTVTMTDDGASLATLTPTTDDGYYVGSNTDSSLKWSSGQTLGFSAQGAGANEGFTGSIVAPTAPSITGIKAMADASTPSVSSPLVVTWAPGTAGQTVTVTVGIFAADAGSTSSGSILCNADDASGSVTVPEAALQANAKSGDVAKVVVTRTVQADVNGGPDVTLLAQSGSEQQVTLGK